MNSSANLFLVLCLSPGNHGLLPVGSGCSDTYCALLHLFPAEVNTAHLVHLNPNLWFAATEDEEYYQTLLTSTESTGGTYLPYMMSIKSPISTQALFYKSTMMSDICKLLNPLWLERALVLVPVQGR